MGRFLPNLSRGMQNHADPALIHQSVRVHESSACNQVQMARFCHNGVTRIR
ncbi:hypothetical protein J7426_03555 [Tropicibacter sp. R16_0]|nr:hypothetical protein [Tropicibacter sp. R16_0]